MLCRTSCAYLAANWRAVPEKKHYDICIIGGGPAGIAAAMRAVDYNKRVCMIEKGPLGGCDLWNGSLESKTMWELSLFLDRLRGKQSRRVFGRPVTDCLELDEDKMQESMRAVSVTRQSQIRRALEATEVDLLVGQATFLSDREVQFHDHGDMKYQNLTADYFLIATGSSPREHPFVPIDRKLIVTSNDIMHQPLPESLVIIGAGVIGCEFASILSGLGKTKVSIIDKAPRILPNEDADISSLVESQLEARGVRIHHASTLYDLQAWEESPEEARAIHPESANTLRSGVQYTIVNTTSRQLTTYNVERALLSIGRRPNYVNLGLENTSLRTRDGRLVVNSVGLCENSKTVFAVGDATSTMLLVSMAEAQAKLAVDYMYGCKRRDTMNSGASLASNMSSVAYLTKALGSVGLNETQCRHRNIAYIACRYGYDLVSRTVAAGDPEGFIKIIVSNDAEMRVLGVRAIGKNASTTVDLGSLAIQNQQTAIDLADRLTAYPAVSQAFQECLRAILGRSGLKPGTFDSLVITKWSPTHFERGVAYQKEMRRAAEAEAVVEAAAATAAAQAAQAKAAALDSLDGAAKSKNSGPITPGSFFTSAVAAK